MGLRYISGFWVATAVATAIGLFSVSALGFDPTEQTVFEEQQDILEVEEVHMAAIPASADASQTEATPPTAAQDDTPEAPEEPPELN